MGIERMMGERQDVKMSRGWEGMEVMTNGGHCLGCSKFHSPKTIQTVK